jgi:mono/diheme cytochrome c family protein
MNAKALTRARRHANCSYLVARIRGVLFVGRICAAAGCVLVLVAVDRANAAGAAQRGAVVFALAAGCSCHTPVEGPVGAGGGKVPTPFGTFFGSNITPDRETGIGAWTDAEIAAAIRDGTARGKGAESPAMPYYQYAGMADADLADLTVYLRSLVPVRRSNQAHEGELPLARWAYWGWRILFFRPPPAPAQAPSTGVARGRYLVDHVSICTDCHTPRTRWGVPDGSMYLAGSSHGPGGDPVPNITPHATGIGDWDIDDIMNVLTLGMLPNFDNVQGYMAEVVDGRSGGPGFKDAPESDRVAIATYVKSVPAIDNRIEDK